MSWSIWLSHPGVYVHLDNVRIPLKPPWLRNWAPQPFMQIILTYFPRNISCVWKVLRYMLLSSILSHLFLGEAQSCYISWSPKLIPCWHTLTYHHIILTGFVRHIFVQACFIHMLAPEQLLTSSRNTFAQPALEKALLKSFSFVFLHILPSVPQFEDICPNCFTLW